MSNRNFILVLFIAAFLFSVEAKAQTFHFKNFRVEDGLPSSKINDIKQDLNGDIWIASDLGVTRYNGYSYRTFTTDHGLLNNSIQKLYVDHENRLWCMDETYRLSLIQNDSVGAYSYNSTLLDALGENHIRSFVVDAQGTLHLGVAQACYDRALRLKLSSTGISSIDTLNKGYYFNKSIGGLFGGNTCPGFNSELTITNGSETKYNLKPTSGVLMSVLANDSLFFAVSDNQVVQLPQKKSYRLKATHSGSALLDSRSQLWIGTYSGLLVFKNSDFTRPATTILKNVSITSIVEDIDGGIWIGTASKGVYYIKNTYAWVYNQLFELEEPRITSLSSDEQDFYFSDSRNNLYIISKSGIRTLGRSSSSVSDIEIQGKKILFLEQQIRKKSELSFPKSGLCFDYSAQENLFWLGRINGFSAYKNGLEWFNSSQIDFKKRVNSIAKGKGREVWVGTLSGLYRFDGEIIQLVKQTEDLRIDGIELLGDSILFISRGNGLGIWAHGEVKMITESDGLASNFCNDFKVYKNEIWVATNAGISRIQNGNIRSFNKSHGLYSSEISSLGVNAKYTVLGTNEGLVVLEKEYLKKEFRLLQTEILEVFNGKQYLELNKNNELPYDQNRLVIQLLAREYRLGKPILYKYRISNDSTWSYSQNPTVQYGSVPSGDWTFECSAQNLSGDWGPINQQFRFSVAKPYYLQWWFIVLAIGITGLLAWIIFRWRYAQLAKQEKSENELNVLKIKALSSQMNPHFIFNSLNSIQNFLVENDLRMSNKYLSKFAKLMRLILNNSNETFVQLKDVLSSLELYLELEQLRFNHRFDFKIEIDPKIELDSTRIPSMLLQPFLENAILHGLLPLKNKGIVTLRLIREGEHNIKAVIEDNGVGREFHFDKLGKKHKSHGLRITRERLKVFESFLGNKFNLSIHDLKDAEGKPTGTRVELNLPCR